MSLLDEYLPSAAEIDEAFGRNGDSHPPGLPPIRDALDLLESVLDEPKELVSNILHQGTKLALGGGSKSFKTWILLDLAIAVSTGKPWLGFETQQSKVLYLNMEIKEVFFQKRIMRICKERETRLQRGQLDAWTLQGHVTSFHELIPKIAERIKSTEYGLIVLDPIYKLYGNLDENKAGDVGRLMSSMDRLCFQSGASTAFGAHFSKGNQSGKESIDRMSGSGVFARDPDSILTLTAHEEEMAFVVESTLRNLPPVNPFVVRWDFPCMNRDSELDPERLKKVAGRSKIWDSKDALNCLPESGLKTEEWMDACRDQNGITERTFYRLKKELSDSEKILLSKIDGKWKPIRSAT